MDLLLSEIDFLLGGVVSGGSGLGAVSDGASEDYSSYLNREERILSLARERKLRRVSSTLLELFPIKKCGQQIDFDDAARIFGEKVIKSVRDKLIFPSEDSDFFDLEPLLSLIHNKYRKGFKLRAPSRTEKQMCLHRCKTNKELVVAEYDNEAEPYLLCFSGRVSARTAETVWYFWINKSEKIGVSDPSLFFGRLLILSEVQKAFDELRAASTSEEFLQNKFIHSLNAGEDKWLSRYKGRSEGVLLPDNALGWAAGRYIRLAGAATRFGKPEDVSFTVETLPLFCLLTDDYCVCKKYGNRFFSFLESFFTLRKELEVDRRVDRELRRLQTEAATVYQTKKNIPEKTLLAMKSSLLNNHFGYVEYDEEVDLNSVKEYEKEFMALCDILGIGKNQGESVRLRKLGRHRASGLYFPGIHCLCVDLRTVSSTGHECFHMIDFQSGELSRQVAFAPVYDKYCELVRKATDGMKLKGKYDIDYYTLPTEVFARCGEMYLVKCAGVHNSLVEPDLKGFDYPCDEELVSLIESYYGEFFAKRINCHEADRRMSC